VRRLLFTVLLAFVLFEATGLSAFVAPETCQVTDTCGAGDGRCSAFCVQCVCCAQPMLRTVAAFADVSRTPVRFEPQASVAPPLVDSPDIFHIPRRLV
jgi:hypothetical protein